MRLGAIAAAGVTALALLGAPVAGSPDAGAAADPSRAPRATVVSSAVGVADRAAELGPSSGSAAARPSTCRARLRKAKARAAQLRPGPRRAAVGAARRASRRCLVRARTTPATPPIVITVPGQPPAPAATSDEFTFLATNDDQTPARWNPCKPITWRVNPAGAPAGAVEVIKAGLAEVSRATGLQLVDGGTTADVPFVTPRGSRAEHLLIGFGTAAAFPQLLTAPTVGYGGPEIQWVKVAGGVTPKEVVAGQVLLSGDAHLAAGFGPRTWGALLLHEVGHAMNLGHVDATREIMNPSLTSQQGAGYAAGDLAGLARLGAGGCFAAPIR